MRTGIAAALLGFTLLASLGWTEAGWAQEKVARVGILSTPLVRGDPDDVKLQLAWYAPFRQTLAQRGWIEGKNVAFEYRSAHGKPPRFSEAVAELVGLKVDVIYADNA